MRDIVDYSNKYIDEPFESTMVEIRKRNVIKQCNKYVHNNILEIGCGINPFFLDFEDYEKMVIVEPSEAFSEEARTLAKDKNIVIYNSLFEDSVDKILKLGIEFDFVILSSLLHEVDNPDELLSSIRSVCSENTVVHINVPNANSIHRLIAKEMAIIDDVHQISGQMKKMQRRRTYDIDSLQKDIKQNGFDVVDKGSYFIKPFTHAQMQACMDANIIDNNILMGLDALTKFLPDYGAGIYVNVKKI